MRTRPVHSPTNVRHMGGTSVSDSWCYRVGGWVVRE